MKLALIIPVLFVLLQLATSQDNDDSDFDDESLSDFSEIPKQRKHRRCHGPPPPGGRPPGPPPGEGNTNTNSSQTGTGKRSVNRRDALMSAQGDMGAGMHAGMGADMGGSMGGGIEAGVQASMGAGMGAGGGGSGQTGGPPNRKNKRHAREARIYRQGHNSRKRSTTQTTLTGMGTSAVKK